MSICIQLKSYLKKIVIEVVVAQCWGKGGGDVSIRFIISLSLSLSNAESKLRSYKFQI